MRWLPPQPLPAGKCHCPYGCVPSGAVLHAALKVAARLEQGNVVMIFADSGWKYLATNLWTQDFHEMGDGEEMDDVIWW